MSYFMLMLTTLGATMMMLSNPMAIMLIILLQSVNMSMILWLMNKTPWFSYILFMIFLGGLMVLFIYITSLASNEKFNPQEKSNLIMIATSMLIILLMTTYFLMYKSYKMINTTSLITLNFSYTMVNPITLVMVYLLITLVVVVKISTKIQGPLRTTFMK